MPLHRAAQQMIWKAEEFFPAGWKSGRRSRPRRSPRKAIFSIQQIPPPPDIGFRVLKVDSSNMADVYDQPDELTQDTLALHVDKLNEDAVRVKWILDGKLESWIYENDD